MRFDEGLMIDMRFDELRGSASHKVLNCVTFNCEEARRLFFENFYKDPPPAKNFKGREITISGDIVYSSTITYWGPIEPTIT